MAVQRTMSARRGGWALLVGGAVILVTLMAITREVSVQKPGSERPMETRRPDRPGTP